VLSHQESTDDAYVAGHMVQLTPEVGGTVVKISAEDTDRVNSGQTVVAFDNSDAKLALNAPAMNLCRPCAKPAN
jgi:membrane fusion protein (multidrug efflux system)